MGKVLSVASRKLVKPLKSFAVESRAEKIISRDKPNPAPWHPSTQQRINELMNGDIMNFYFQNI